MMKPFLQARAGALAFASVSLLATSQGVLSQTAGPGTDLHGKSLKLSGPLTCTPGATCLANAMSVTPSRSAPADTLSKLLSGAVPADGPAAPSSQLATAAWVRSFGSGYASVLSCLNPAQLGDVLGGAGTLDLTSTLQSCFSSLGSVTVLWPAGTYRVLGTITPPDGQKHLGVGTGWNSGSIIVNPVASNVPTFRLTSAQMVKGFAFRGSNAATAGNCLIAADGTANQTNGVQIRDNFFFGGYEQICLKGQVFYANIENNRFGGGSVYALTTSGSTPAGVDFVARGNHFVGITADRTVSVVKMSGLGSVIWTDNVISVSTTSGPSFHLQSVSSLYGGFQSTNSVWEQNGSQPTFFAEGDKDHPIPYIHIANGVFTGNAGPAVKLGFTAKARFVGGAMGSSSSLGVLYAGPGAVNSDVSLTDVGLESLGPGAPIHFAAGSSGSVSMANVKWQGSTPVFDGSAMDANALAYFDWFGGRPGANAMPFLLPAGAKVSVTYGGSTLLVGGKLGVGTLTPGNLATITGPSLNYTASASGNATMRVTSGTGSALDPGLSFGSNAGESWIQSVQPGSATLPLRLNGGGGGVLTGKPPAGLKDVLGVTYVPAYAGTPAAAPTAFGGYAPIAVDTANGKICSYVASAWKCATLQ